MTMQLAQTRNDRRATSARGFYWAETVGCRVQLDDLEGHVEATFDRACNLVLTSGGLVTVLASNAGNVAHGIRLAHQERMDNRYRKGMPVHVSSNRLIFGDGVV